MTGGIARDALIPSASDDGEAPNTGVPARCWWHAERADGVGPVARPRYPGCLLSAPRCHAPDRHGCAFGDTRRPSAY